METKVPNPEDNTITDIENVYFLEFIKMYLKTNLFLNEADIKNLIIAYLKLAKKIETTDNMNINHIKFMEKFKSYLLNKGKVIISKDEKENEDDNEDSNESESKEKKKSEVELEEEGSDNEEEKSEEEKGEQELSVEKERSKISTIRKKKKVNKKRNYKESQKAIENEEDFKELTDEVSMYILDNSKHKDTSFVIEISEHIVNRALDNHIDICFILAQGHLETHFGSYGIGKSRKSIFGVYKYYGSYTECIDYYINFLTSFIYFFNKIN